MNIELHFTNEKINQAYTYLSGTTECFIPFGYLAISTDEDKKKITSEIAYLNGFLKSVQTKLANKRFVSNARTEIIENEKKKQKDAEAKIKALQERLLVLNGH